MLKKIILTGGPTSGKTTLIKELEKRQYQVVHEVARDVLHERKKYEPTKKEWEIRQEMIFDRSLANEQKNYNETVFFDRSILDGVAYSRFYGINFNRSLHGLDINERYSQIFLLDMFPFEDDGLRTEKGDDDAKKIEELLVQTYENQGLSFTRVPILTIQERVNFILERIT